MTSTKALAYVRNDFKARIVADAGPEGIKAVLLQLQGDEWRAVSYALRNRPMPTGESLLVVVEHYSLLLGCDFAYNHHGEDCWFA